MMLHKFGHMLLVLGSCLCGCVAPKGEEGTETSPAELALRVDEIQESLDALRESVEALSAGSSRDELRALTIERVAWGDDLGLPEWIRTHYDDSVLICHVTEWEGFPKMKRWVSSSSWTWLRLCSHRWCSQV